jgi:hypothetical protein
MAPSRTCRSTQPTPPGPSAQPIIHTPPEPLEVPSSSLPDEGNQANGHRPTGMTLEPMGTNTDSMIGAPTSGASSSVPTPWSGRPVSTLRPHTYMQAAPSLDACARMSA